VRWKKGKPGALDNEGGSGPGVFHIFGFGNKMNDVYIYAVKALKCDLVEQILLLNCKTCLSTTSTVF
jgi:hypothetical protein